MNIATTPPRQGEDLLRPSRETDGGRTDLEFLDFTWSRRTLSQAGTPIRLTPKESLVLGLLLARAGQVVPISELITTGWGDEPVGPESLNRCLSGLRRKVPTICEHLRTHHRMGYCLDLAVRKIKPGQAANPGDQVSKVLRTAERLTGLFSAECCAAALRVLRNALEVGLEDPRIYAAIAEIEFSRLMFGHAAPRSAAAAALAAARRATGQGAPDARVLALLGLLRVTYGDDVGGLQMTDEAFEIAPDDPEVQRRRQVAYQAVGVLLELPKVPGFPGPYAVGEEYDSRALNGISLMQLGQTEEAREIVQQGIALFPYDHRVLMLGAMIESRLGDHEVAIEYARTLCQTRSRGSGQGECLLAMILHLGGHGDEAEALLDATLKDSRSFRPSAFAAAALHYIRGADAGADMLERARTLGCPHVRWFTMASGMIPRAAPSASV